MQAPPEKAVGQPISSLKKMGYSWRSGGWEAKAYTLPARGGFALRVIKCSVKMHAPQLLQVFSLTLRCTMWLVKMVI
jgi:hypothetical protein